MGADRGSGRRRTAPETLGASAPRLPSGARTRTPSCPSAGRWPFLLQYKGSLLRSHKSRQDPLFQQALWANRRKSAEFPNGPKSLTRWERLKEGNNRPPALIYPNLCQYPSTSPGRREFEILRKGGKKKENLLFLSRPKGGIKHSRLVGFLP